MFDLSIEKTYWFAFSILAIWATFAFMTMFALIESQEQYGTLINISGKQRMLSQKTAYLSHMVHHNEAASERLTSLVLEMKRDHAFIAGHLPSKKLSAYYFGPGGLDQTVKRYFGLLDTFASEPNDLNMANIARASQPLLKKLHRAVNLFEQENRAIVNKLRNRELLIYIGTLLTLALEAFLIIKPMIKSHKQYLQKLEAEVDKQTKEIQIFAKIFENAREGMIITDENEKILDANHAFTQITGYQKEEILGETPRILKSGQQDAAFYKEMWDTLHDIGIWFGQIINRKKNGQEFFGQTTIMKLVYRGAIYYVNIFTDTTKHLHQMREMNYLANHDSLTGLLSRKAVSDRIEHAVKLADKTQKPLAVLFLDLDNFKVINDSLGHATGDMLLKEYSKRLSACIRESDTLGRLSGDEFVLLLEALDRQGDETVVLNKLLRSLSKPFHYKGNTLHVTASIGVAYYPGTSSDGDISAHNLMRKADLAMYKAKGLGKNQVAYYSDDLVSSVTSKLMIENRLRDAIGNREFELYLQPKVDINTRKIVSAELLLRWKSNGEIIPPNSFIPIAEETNLIKKIDQWVAEESIRLVKQIHDEDFSDFSVAFNLSGRSFSDKRVIDGILDTIYNGGKAEYIEIEITEGVVVENTLFTSNTIKKIKSLGITVALDDFGTGYSSFSYLSWMPFNTIKIDRSFIANLHQTRQKILVEAIIWFSDKLGMNIIAEGVETEDQFNWLKNKKCKSAQGYLFGKPVPLDEFRKLL